MLTSPSVRYFNASRPTHEWRALPPSNDCFEASKGAVDTPEYGVCGVRFDGVANRGKDPVDWKTCASEALYIASGRGSASCLYSVGA
jgi:hypothetical protein